jgi:hypothetical protein
MSYPESSEVSAGQPTASAHYNNLRKDAVYLGMAAADAAALGALLARFEEGLRLELLSTNRIRVPATSTELVYLVINGYMLTASANVDLSTGDAPSGSAAQYYVFAVRADSSTTFTLDVSTTATETTDKRRIGGFYWDGSQIDASSIYTERRDYLLDNLAMQSKQVFGGRLTLQTGTPVPSNVASSGTVYYTPYKGNRVSVYGEGLGWKEHTFSELSVSLSGATADQPVDIFLYDDAGTLTLEVVEWSSASARATALTTQDGVYVKSGAPGHVYLGTVGITDSAGVSADTYAQRFVWNMYNRVLRDLSDTLGYNSWAYTTSAWRAAYNDPTACLIELVAGLSEEAIMITGAAMMQSTSANNAGIGIGDNVHNNNSATIRAQHLESGIGPCMASLVDGVTLGQRAFYLVEWGAAGVTFYGSNGGSEAVRAGMTAVVMM